MRCCEHGMAVILPCLQKSRAESNDTTYIPAATASWASTANRRMLYIQDTVNLFAVSTARLKYIAKSPVYITNTAARTYVSRAISTVRYVDTAEQHETALICV
eukprot:GHRR01025059.1.p1 GENE.GHRR01025059.1~~GHRR01025059.1.p1  ORF type:complete len:103 (+),score=37.11 GHRR01025059.1:3-311(+)